MSFSERERFIYHAATLMTTQVNSSFLRTENKKQIAPFLRSEGVL